MHLRDSPDESPVDLNLQASIRFSNFIRAHGSVLGIDPSSLALALARKTFILPIDIGHRKHGEVGENTTRSAIIATTILPSSAGQITSLSRFSTDTDHHSYLSSLDVWSRPPPPPQRDFLLHRLMSSLSNIGILHIAFLRLLANPPLLRSFPCTLVQARPSSRVGREQRLRRPLRDFLQRRRHAK